MSISILIWITYLVSELIDEGLNRDFYFAIAHSTNLAIMVGVVNYYGVPKFFFTRRYWQFLALALLMILVAAFVLEGVLEILFYPDTRGRDGFGLHVIQHEFWDITVIAVLFLSLKLAWDFQERQNFISRLEKEKFESESNFLKSQLNPHVLFNNLNNIYSFALHKSDLTPQLILKLSDIMRYMLYEGNQETVSLKTELAYMENYIELQKTQLEGRSQVTYENEGNVEGYRIAPLILVSFVENCFKHSAATTVEDIRITIYTKIESGKFSFYCENNYTLATGLKEGEPQVGGVGLENVKRRLEMLYPEKHHLILKNIGNRFIVNLDIDLI